MIEVYACDFSGNGVFVMFIADLLQTRRATTSKSRPGFTGIGPTHNARSALVLTSPIAHRSFDLRTVPNRRVHGEGVPWASHAEEVPR